MSLAAAAFGFPLLALLRFPLLPLLLGFTQPGGMFGGFLRFKGGAVLGTHRGILRGEFFSKGGHVIFKTGLSNPIGCDADPYFAGNSWGGVFGGLYDLDPYHMPNEGKAAPLPKLDSAKSGPLAYFPFWPSDTQKPQAEQAEISPIEKLRQAKEQGKFR